MSFATENNEFNQKLENEWMMNEQKETLADINKLGTLTNRFVRDIAKLKQYETILGTQQDSQKLRSDALHLLSDLGNTLYGLNEKLEQINLTIEQKVDSHSQAPLKKVMDYVANQMKQAEDQFFNAQQKYIAKSQLYSLESNSNGNILHETSLQDKTLPQESDKQPLLQQESIQQLENPYLPQIHAELVQQRETAITNISQGVQDINAIFRDLDHLVTQQGAQIDTIENNIDNYASNNQLATRELMKAEEYQRRKGKWCFIILVVLIIVILLLVALMS